jgi:hypothetical protein
MSLYFLKLVFSIHQLLIPIGVRFIKTRLYLFIVLCKFSILILPQLSSQSALAAADITKVSGASTFTDSVTAPEILGGTGGGDCSGDVTTDETCNSCEENTLAVCNTRKVYPSLKLRIEFVDTAVAGKTLVTETVDNQAIDLEESESTEDQTLAAGDTHVAVVTWSNLCNILNDGDTTCSTSFNKKIRIGVTENGSEFKGTTLDINIRLVIPDAENTVPSCDTATRGICNFVAYPGDKKVYIEDVQAEGESFPSDSNVNFKYFRVIYSSEGFNKEVLNPREAIDAGQFADIEILDSESNTIPELADNVVDDLSNNTLYFFRGMLIDEANNLTDITDDSVYTDHPDCPDDVNTAPATAEEEFLCPLTARPDVVVGLLKEDFNCFISTVSFGSAFHAKVADFRKFRKVFLLPYSWGNEFNKIYYKYGSIFANIIKDSKFLKHITRVFLYPLWAFAKISLTWGILPGMLYLLTLFSLPFLFFLIFKKYFKKNFKFLVAAKPSKPLVSFVLYALLITQLTPRTEAQEVVETVKKNSLPSSQYENLTNKDIRVKHPNAKKGLTRITANKDYLYEVVESPQNHRVNVKFGTFDPTNLESDGKEFTSIYKKSDSPMVLIDYEWKWTHFIFDVNWQIGTGIYFTQGNGVFESNPDYSAREKFTFIAIPLSAHIIIKLRFYENQWLIPYGGGGLGVMGFSELRDDNAGPKFGGAAMAPVFGGAALSINAISPSTGRLLDREYGINRTLFAVELRQYLNLGSDYDFSSNLINAGLMIEY